MINYNTREWFSLIFKFHKSDTFRILLPAMFLLAVFCLLIAYLQLEVYQFQVRSTTIIHSLLGFVISLLLVFRTNTAYDRWWEGRRQWGSLLNSSRNLAIKLNAFLPAAHAEREAFTRLISQYAFTLSEHLKDRKVDGIPRDVGHQPNYLASEIFRKCNELHNNGVISGEQLLVLSPEVQSFTEICGACERIKKTPIPYAYSLFVKKFIFVYILTMPFSFVADFKYSIVPIVVFVFYVLASLELLAEEIEEPFGGDANDLPTKEIAVAVQESVTALLVSRA